MTTDILLLFTNFCDSNLPSIKQGTTLSDKYHALGAPTATNFFSVNELLSFIENRLKKICNENPELDFRVLSKLRKSLIFEGISKRNRQYYNYLDIALTLEGIIRRDIKNIPDFENLVWNEIIQLVKNYLLLSDAYCQLRKDFYKKEIDTAKAIINLNSLGCDINIVNCNIVIKKEELVLKKVEQGIKNIGGQSFLKILLEDILYVNEFERFLILRQGNQVDTSKVEIEVPHAYLFNLAVKHIDKKPKKKINVKNEFEQVILVAKQLCLVKYQVQSYTIWEDIVHSSRESCQYLNDLVLRGSLFDIPQFQSRYAQEFCIYILKKEAEKFRELLPYDLDDLIKVVNYLFSISSKTVIEHFFIIRLVKEIGLELQIIDKILNDLSHKCGEVNSDYFSPTDYLNVTFWQKPLLRVKSGEYILLPKSLTGLSFYEAIISKVRELDPHYDIDSKVGNIHLENFLKYKLATKNITYSCGKYKEKIDGKNIEGEADLIIESDSGILLVESKKKALTRKAKSGDDHAIFFDLVGSIFESQFQCFRTDALLRINNRLTVDVNSSKTEILWNDRSVDRYTFTLSDYGVMQDRIILDQILTELLSPDFKLVSNSEDELVEMAKKINSFSKKKGEFIKYLNIVNDVNPFFSSGFLNLHQFMFLIEKSHDNESLIKAVNNLKHVSRGSFDFYQEYFLAHDNVWTRYFVS